MVEAGLLALAKDRKRLTNLIFGTQSEEMNKQYHFSETSMACKVKKWCHEHILRHVYFSVLSSAARLPAAGSESPPHCSRSSANGQAETVDASDGHLRTRVSQGSYPH